MSFILISTDKRILSLPLSIYPEIPALYCKLEREKKKSLPCVDKDGKLACSFYVIPPW